MMMRTGGERMLEVMRKCQKISNVRFMLVPGVDGTRLVVGQRGRREMY